MMIWPAMKHLIKPQKPKFDPKISNFYEGTQWEQQSVHKSTHPVSCSRVREVLCHEVSVELSLSWISWSLSSYEFELLIPLCQCGYNIHRRMSRSMRHKKLWSECFKAGLNRSILQAVAIWHYLKARNIFISALGLTECYYWGGCYGPNTLLPNCSSTYVAFYMTFKLQRSHSFYIHQCDISEKN